MYISLWSFSRSDIFEDVDCIWYIIDIKIIFINWIKESKIPFHMILEYIPKPKSKAIDFIMEKEHPQI